MELKLHHKGSENDNIWPLCIFTSIAKLHHTIYQIEEYTFYKNFKQTSTQCLSKSTKTLNKLFHITKRPLTLLVKPTRQLSTRWMKSKQKLRIRLALSKRMFCKWRRTLKPRFFVWLSKPRTKSWPELKNFFLPRTNVLLKKKRKRSSCASRGCLTR